MILMYRRINLPLHAAANIDQCLLNRQFVKIFTETCVLLNAAQFYPDADREAHSFKRVHAYTLFIQKLMMNETYIQASR